MYTYAVVAVLIVLTLNYNIEYVDSSEDNVALNTAIYNAIGYDDWQYCFTSIPYLNNSQEITKKQLAEIMKSIESDEDEDEDNCGAAKLFVHTIVYDKRMFKTRTWTDIIQTIMYKPPPKQKNEKEKKMTVKQFNLTDVYYTSWNHVPYFVATMKLTWTDTRVKGVFKKSGYHKFHPNFPISSHYGWYPSLGSASDNSNDGDKSVHVYQSYHSRMIKDVKGNSEISIIISHAWGTKVQCDANYDNFPYDTHTCIADVMFNSDIDSHFKINMGSSEQRSMKITVDPKALIHHPDWNILNDATCQVISQLDRKGLRVTYRVKRHSTTIVAETIPPLLIVSLMVLIVPAFLQWTLQMALKLLGTVLYLGMMYMLMTGFGDISRGGTTPKIVRCYDFFVYTTAISGLVTLILYSLSKIKRTLPPSHMLVTVTTIANNIVPCTLPTTTHTTTPTNDKTTEAVECPNQWLMVFYGLNNIFLVVFFVIYIVGFIAIVA